ncbi:restriction endonuclease subunit S [Gelidibacter maritimus]|uniref:Restriction endonuclease subunit S n=1 Tax=Gelidibacter maritimus TaxID=2761487 RepID=A0A7W2R395_9FLAO|nr:restriction endonuclease subunit S [Gelidibacter maritimus]MBA6152398.1 restriction endonuclease subunit S [Gelidibacter maritimus]
MHNINSQIGSKEKKPLTTSPPKSTVQTYSRYKDSGVEWLGEIPEHWEVRKIKYLFKEKNSLFIDGDWIESKDLGSDEVYYFTTGNIREIKFYDKERSYISNDTFRRLNCTAIAENDILISRLNVPLGRCCIAPKFDKKSIVSVDVCVFRPDKGFNRGFLVYLMNSPQYFTHTENEARGAIMKRISRSILGNIDIPIPPLQEQTAIANFLDDKTEKIDQAICIKKQQIALLKERKQILIHKAVTRGLDDYVPLKDSGVKWVGEIPEHWASVSFRRISSLQQGLQIAIDKRLEEPIGDALEYITTKSIHNPNDPKHYVTKPKENVICDYQDVLLGRTGNTGEVVTNIRGVFHNNFFKIDYDKNKIERDFLVNYLNTQGIQELIMLSAGVTTIPDLNHGEFLSLPIVLPPLSEQKEISKYIERASQKIDTAISLKQQEIAKLQEYKRSLINSVVTGKVKVC